MSRSEELVAGRRYVITAVVARIGRRQEQAIWVSLKRFLEAQDSPLPAHCDQRAVHMRKDVREFIRRLEAAGVSVEATPGHYRVFREGKPLRKTNMLPFSPNTIRWRRGGKECNEEGEGFQNVGSRCGAAVFVDESAES